jgi:uncharacterized protein (DUF433 family)
MEPTTSQNQDSSTMVGTLSVTREHIVSTPDTCGGKPRIAGSRIQVKHVVVMHERQGMTPEQIVSEYPHLTLGGIDAALAYYRVHREDVDADIRAEREWYEEKRTIQGKALSLANEVICGSNDQSAQILGSKD